MDPLVGLFREQVALLQQQAKVLEEQAAALGRRGVAVPELPQTAAPAPVRTAPAAAPPVAPQAKVRAPEPALPGPDTAARVAGAILASVARISAFPVEAIKPSQTLASDLGFDSLMTVELDGDINKAFPGAGGLPRSLLGPQTTVQDVVDHVARAVAQPPAPISPVFSQLLGEVASEGRELLRFAPAWVEAQLPARRPRRARCRAGCSSPATRSVSPRRSQLSNRSGIEAVLGRAGDALAGVGGVIHLSPLSRAESELSPGFDAVLETHRLARAQVSGAAGGMLVLATSGADGGIDAALAGYVKSLARERTDELVKCVELRLEDGAAAMAHALFAELRSGNAVPLVRWAEGTRFEQNMRPAASGQPIEIGERDVVLVTGGTRGIGLKLAHALLQKGAKVALAGRTAPGTLPEGAAFVQWDVTRPAGAALEAARAALGPFTAVVHAAGIAEDAAAADAPDDSVERVLATKLAGFWVAVLATSQDPIRAVVAISSWAGRFGNAGRDLLCRRQRGPFRGGVGRLAAASGRGGALLHTALGRHRHGGEVPPSSGARWNARACPSSTTLGVAAFRTRCGRRHRPVLLAHDQAGARGRVQDATAALARGAPFLDDHQLAGPAGAAARLGAGRQRRPGRRAVGQGRRAGCPPARLPAPAARAHRRRCGAHVSARPATTSWLSRSPRRRRDRRRSFCAFRSYVAFARRERHARRSARPAAPGGRGPARAADGLGDFYGSLTFHGPRLRGIECIEQITPRGIVAA